MSGSSKIISRIQKLQTSVLLLCLYKLEWKNEIQCTCAWRQWQWDSQWKPDSNTPVNQIRLGLVICILQAGIYWSSTDDPLTISKWSTDVLILIDWRPAGDLILIYWLSTMDLLMIQYLSTDDLIWICSWSTDYLLSSYCQSMGDLMWIAGDLLANHWWSIDDKLVIHWRSPDDWLVICVICYLYSWFFCKC